MASSQPTCASLARLLRGNLTRGNLTQVHFGALRVASAAASLLTYDDWIAAPTDYGSGQLVRVAIPEVRGNDGNDASIARARATA